MPVEVHGGTVGSGTAVQVGRSRVRFQMVSLEFFMDVILLAALGLTQPLQKVCGLPTNLTGCATVIAEAECYEYLCPQSMSNGSDGASPQIMS